MDEVEAAIKGRVDNWRYERRNAHLIHVSLVGSEKAVNIYDALGLPYDDELRKMEKEDEEQTIDEATALYEYAKKVGYFNTPIKGIA